MTALYKCTFDIDISYVTYVMWLEIVINKPTDLQPTLYKARSGPECHAYIRRSSSSCRMTPTVSIVLFLFTGGSSG